jgi:7-cyano-7-deazaguanine synthase
MVKTAVVLLSGGMDSATALYWARSKGLRCRALSFDYGQRHTVELEAAGKLARNTGCAWDLVRFRLPWTKTSSLLDHRRTLPHHSPAHIGRGGIPSTYVPARNTIFLSFALAACDAAGTGAIIIGANAIDFSGYPDCRPAYFSAVRRVARTGTRRGVEGRSPQILTPLLHLDKGQIVKLGARLKVPFELTWSCYRGGRRPCEKCDACLLRARGFQEAGLEDPLLSS